MTRSSILTSVNDFVALPIEIAPSPSYSESATHYLYLRANAPKIPTEDTPREVFLVNVPVDSTEAHIRELFANQLGGARIESVAFEGTRVGKGITAPVVPVKQGKKRKRGAENNSSAANGPDADEEVGLLPVIWDRQLHHSGSTAIATFVDKASVDLALRVTRKAAKSAQRIMWPIAPAGQPSLGSARYLAHHRLRYVPAADLQASVDAYMTAFAAHEAARAAQLARQRAEPDADGFITVVRGGRNGPAREEDAAAKLIELEKRNAQRIKDDFYRFQTRERKKIEARELAVEFEEDRRKLEEMKRRRGRIRPE